MQPEAYRHDYSAIERRLKQLDAPAYRQRLMGQSVLVVALTAAACALLLTGAYAWRLVTEPEQVEQIVEQTEPTPAPDLFPGLPDFPEEADVAPGIVTTNFSLFRHKEVEIAGRTYVVRAGHQYLTESDTVFANAWCYTDQTIDEVDVKIHLGTLEPNSMPVRLPVSSQTLAHTGLTLANHEALFASCPWLSGNPNVEESVSPSSGSPDI